MTVVADSIFLDLSDSTFARISYPNKAKVMTVNGTTYLNGLVGSK